MQKGIYGKFGSAEELLKGYNALQQAFTQKCQQLAELTKSLSVQSSDKGSGTDQTVLKTAVEQQAATSAYYGKSSPSGTSGLLEGGTNAVSSPQLSLQGAPVVNDDGLCRGKCDLQDLNAQTNIATGTNEASPSICSVGRTVTPQTEITLHQATQAALLDKQADTSVPRNDVLPGDIVVDNLSQNDMVVDGKQTSIAHEGNVADVVQNDTVVANGKQKIDTYEEIGDTNDLNTNAIDANNGMDDAPRGKIATDLERAQRILAENPQLVAKILGGVAVELPPAVMGSGGNLSLAMPTRPKTLREASELAKKYFD